jgi:hypothetical protein
MADADVPIKYMDRTRHYYRALGYAQDYIWATAEAVCPACGGQTSTQHSVVIAEACHCLRRHQCGVVLRVRDCRMGDVCRVGLE